MKTLGDLIAPFSGEHNPLRGGWSDDQLQRVIEALQESAGASFTPTDAMLACSLVAEKLTTGMPLRYPRSQRNYSFFENYQGDPLMTYRRVVPSADKLIALGLADGTKGSWMLKKQSILKATPTMMAIIGHLVDISSRQGAMLTDEIVLRDGDGNALGFTDSVAIRHMRVEMKSINAHLATQQYFLDGSQLHVPPAARIFNKNFHRGGRLYHQGSSYQQMPKDKRAKIVMAVDGEFVPTVERDFESLHMRLTYRRAGKQVPAGDLYRIDGFTRELAKVATLIALNADGTEVGAITGILEQDEDLAVENGLNKLAKWELRAAVEKLIAAIKRKHYRVREFFGTGVGAELMRTDSDMAVDIMLRMIQQTGRCPLVLHDSFIVPTGDALLLDEVMASALPINASKRSNDLSSPLPIHLGKHVLEQEQRALVAKHDRADHPSRSPSEAWDHPASPPPRAVECSRGVGPPCAYV